jgi:hypothetical protein
MNKLTPEQINSLLEAGYELRALEFKSPFSWIDPASRWLKEKVTRAILGMTNTRFGGQIVVGIEEGKNGELVFKGLTEDELKSFEDYDRVKGYVDGFSYNDTNFDLAWGELQGKKYVVFTVQEFYEIPAICKDDGQEKDVLKRHQIYVRSKKAPYSTIPATETELREIIHMAVDKEKAELASRGWVKEGAQTPEQYYKEKIKDLI